MNDITTFAIAHPFWTYIIVGIAFAIYRVLRFELQFVDLRDKGFWIVLTLNFISNTLLVGYEAPRMLSVWIKWKYRRIKRKKEHEKFDKMLQEMESKID